MVETWKEITTSALFCVIIISVIVYISQEYVLHHLIYTNVVYNINTR